MASASADGAASAATHFMTLYRYAYATGDVTEWDALSSDTCDFCASTREGATRVASSGARIEGGEITVTSAAGTEVDPGRWYSATLTVSEAPSREIAASGDVVKSSEGGDYEFFLALSFVDGGWQVDAVEFQQL